MGCKIDLRTIDRRKDESLNDYHDRAYQIFKNTLMNDVIKYDDLPVKVREIPIEDNKVQGFFHVISEQDKKSKVRLYKEERVKYIPFISKMITEFAKCYNCEEDCSKIKRFLHKFCGV